MKKLADKYNHLEVENGLNEQWISEGYFQEHDLSKEPFTIVIPPPNVTGKLHLGHAWDTTLQDVMIRYKKLQGFDTLWLPGMDHAGIATQAKVEEKLALNGVSRYDLGREKFIKQSWDWKEEYANHIREQWGKLGLALDYSKERFTLDSGLSDAVSTVFVDLYNKGYIYQGERIINWDPKAKTALSNIEVDHIEINGREHYFKYLFEDNSGYLEIMTTRPETMFGDGAIAVNPKDDRYKHLEGKKVLVPVSGIAIPIILDDYVDMEVGSGCVKITPAHDPNDFQVGVRHNVPFRIIMDETAHMASNEWVPVELQGLDRYDARKKVIELTKANDTLVKVLEIVHSVGHSQRTGVVVEPYLSKQWFVKMDELSEQALKLQSDNKGIDFYPERFNKTFTQWMEKIEDWCISRQLWWGHRIPAWYHKDTNEVYVGITPPLDIENYIQDEDVLDTWFSSGLWPFSTLGWPEDSADYNRYYPTSLLVTGYDIIFFWISRMIFLGVEFTEQKPFNDVLIHGLVRDSEGRKMSKSLGNGVDPIVEIEKYGADALRFFLTTNSSPGQDLRYIEEKVLSTWNFINKLWNASRFVEMNITSDINGLDQHDLDSADKWILNRLQLTIQEVTTNMDKYEFTVVGTTLYNFIWNDFCSWYLELAKATSEKNGTKQTLKFVLIEILKMLHPFMPFVTERIYTMITDDKTIVTSNYPKYNPSLCYEDTSVLEFAQEIIIYFRELRKEHNIKRAVPIYYDLDFTLDDAYLYIEKMVNCKHKIQDYKKVITKVLSNGLKITTDLSMVEEANPQTLFDEYQAELIKLENEIRRASMMLSNDKFLSKAPANKVEDEKNKLLIFENKRNELIKLMSALKVNK